MQSIVLSAHAKVNLSLDVLKRRPDGYHEVDMILQSIDLADEVILEHSDAIELCGALAETPNGPENLVWKAAALLATFVEEQERAGGRGVPGRGERTRVKSGRAGRVVRGVRITLNKEIPAAAGLGGGSADAAAVLVGLNQLWDLSLSIPELEALGAKLGADVPFCIRGGCARARGIGTELTFLQGAQSSSGVRIPLLDLVLFTPHIPVSTAEVYRYFDSHHCTWHPDVTAVWEGCQHSNMSLIARHWGNVLQPVTLGMHSELAQLRDRFESLAGTPVIMSGSGPSLFTVQPDAAAAQNLANQMRDWPGQVFAVSTFPCGVDFGGNTFVSFKS